jgi:hypothetical protein
MFVWTAWVGIVLMAAASGDDAAIDVAGEAALSRTAEHDDAVQPRATFGARS